MTVVSTILSIISPFFIAISIAFVVNIPTSKIENTIFKKIKKKKFRRPLSIFSAFFLIILFFTLILVFLIPQLSDSIKTLTQILPDYIKQLEDLFTKFANYLNIPTNIWNQLVAEFNKILEFLGTVIFSFVPMLFDFTIGVANGTINFFLGLVLSFYLLSSKETLIISFKRLIKSIFSKKVTNYLEHVGDLTNRTFSSFISGQMIESLILGTLCTVGLVILRIDYALLIGVIIGISSIIPIFGSILGTIPCVFILLVISPKQALVFLIFIFILQQLEGDIIYPRVVGKTIGISGLWVMFAMIVGGSLMGIMGLLLGIPLFAVLYALLQEWVDNRLKDK